MTNLNEISKQVYEANKLKGFDVKNENLGQTLMLIVSELSEALEALRKNRRANLELYDHNTTNNGVEFELAFQVEIKDTFDRLGCSTVGSCPAIFYITDDRTFHAQREVFYL